MFSLLAAKTYCVATWPGTRSPFFFFFAEKPHALPEGRGDERKAARGLHTITQGMRHEAL